MLGHEQACLTTLTNRVLEKIVERSSFHRSKLCKLGAMTYVIAEPCVDVKGREQS